MPGVLSLAQGIKKAIPYWNPSLHPRDRKGQFIEVGEYVRVFDGPNGSQIDLGKVNGSHYDQGSKRLFIGVDVGNGETKWYRPKQLENVQVKGALDNGSTPSMPLPTVDSMADNVEWDFLDPASTHSFNKINSGDLEGLPEALDPDYIDQYNPGFKQEAGLDAEEPEGPEPALDDTPAPSPSKSDFVSTNDASAPGEIKIPEGKTPVDVLRLMDVTLLKKIKAGNEPFGWDEYDSKFEAMLNSGDYNSAFPKLNEIMVALKLGGRQRKRYREALALHFGGHQAAEITKKEDAPGAPSVPHGDAEKPSAPFGTPDASMDAPEATPAPEPFDAPVSSLDDFVGNLPAPEKTPSIFTPMMDTETGPKVDWPEMDSMAQSYGFMEDGDDGSGKFYVMQDQTEQYPKIYVDQDGIGAIFEDEGDEHSNTTEVGKLFNEVKGQIGPGQFGYEPEPEPEPSGPMQFSKEDFVAPEDAIKNGKLKPYTDADLKALGPVKVLSLLKTQFQSQFEQEKHTNYGKGLFEQNFDSMINTDVEDFENALIYLNAIAKQMKLGGRQRARYRNALAMLYGVEAPDKSKPKAEKPTAPAAPAEDLSGPVGDLIPEFYENLKGWYDTLKKASDSGTQNEITQTNRMAYLNKVDILAGDPDSPDPEKVSVALDNLLQVWPSFGFTDAEGNWVSHDFLSEQKASIQAFALYARELAAKQVNAKKAAAAADKKPYDPTDVSTFPEITANKPANVKNAQITTATKANQLVQGGGANPASAKANVQASLSARMKGKHPPEKLIEVVKNTEYQYNQNVKDLADALDAALKGNSFPAGIRKGYEGNWELTSQYSNPNLGGTISNPTVDQLTDALNETVVNAMIKLWAQSSNDNNPLSLAMQNAAVTEFNLTDHYDWPMSPDLAERVKFEQETHGDFHRTFLRTMYEHTQEWAKVNGVTHLKLKRGVKEAPGGGTKYSTSINVGDKLNAKLRPMSSFASNVSIAKRFGWFRMEAVVPIEWVIGCAATGFGCYNEYEWVVLGGIHEAKRIS